MERITLYYQQGSADKIYQASIGEANGGHVVRFAYGRRGTTLQTGTKTTTPVSFAEAKRVYDKLVAGKCAKGYSPGDAGTPYQHTEREQQVSGIQPQLLNPIETEEAARLVTDPAWLLQEKFDGRRTLIRKTDDRVEGLNRRGLIVALPMLLTSTVSQIAASFVADGECVGDVFYAFDLLELGERDLRTWRYRDRLAALVQLLFAREGIVCAETAADTAHKAEMLERLRRLKKDGVVFKKASGPWVPGRPASGGDALKLKFCATASFRVAHVNARRSVALELLDGEQWQAAGNVTIPPGQEIPATGQIVEVRYLYAFRESGVIYQPVYLGERDDILSEKCVVSQLKFKAPVQAA